MDFLRSIEGIGAADIFQWAESTLYNVKYTNLEGELIDLGDFKTLNQARNAAYRYQTGEDSAIVKEQPRIPEP